MYLPVRRALAITFCVVALTFVAFGIVGDLTSNHGLWTLGGPVGISRTAIAVSICLAVAVILLALNGNGGGPFIDAR